MNITDAVYNIFEGKTIGITAVIDGVKTGVPIDEQNRHYAEIMRQVEAGELTIADAD